MYAKYEYTSPSGTRWYAIFNGPVRTNGCFTRVELDRYFPAVRVEGE